ncbi:BnaC06g15660D [Brassica napus]|uniref:BnaC06g15660D protein n=1 Tax=Brassica napus TaxID=3708 RepID=A0A078IB50_BRANA|nr:BnaC06g15660D [Brassica napus]
MVAPLLAAVSSDLEPMEKALFTESTLSQLGFPNEFPYEFDSYAFTSPGDSTETEDEDDFFAGLTRRLALSTQRLPSPPPPFAKAAEVNSTESTRSGLGGFTTSGNRSPSGPFSQAPSRPESPCVEEDSLKVISAAAGEVAKIKRANLDSKPSSRTNPNLNPFIPFPQNAAFGSYYYWLQQQPPQISNYHQSPIRFVSTLQPALIAFPFPGRGVFAAAKQPSAGTGVFLPKNHRNPLDSRKKGGGGCVELPTKVVQTQHLKTQTFSGRWNSRSQARLSTHSNIPNLRFRTLKKTETVVVSDGYWL